MSDTTGWLVFSEHSLEKVINGHRWWIERKAANLWQLRLDRLSHEQATRPTLRECQILAHDTARLWAGEDASE